MMGQIVHLSGLPNTHLLLSNVQNLQNVCSCLRVLPGVKTCCTCILFALFKHLNNDIATKNSGVDYSSGGGSIIYYRNDINAKIVKDFSEGAPDSLAIELDSNIGQFCIACIYSTV